MPDWPIKIVKQSNGKTVFVPVQPNAKPGDPLIAQQYDNVYWSNTTDKTHTITVLNGTDSVTLPAIPAGESSIYYNITQPDSQPSSWIITYSCTKHPTEKGTINASVIPVTTIPPS
jgi:hypothetical protein